MTMCLKSEWTCFNGQCIDINKRCNRISDCIDSSDELECEKPIFSEGYVVPTTVPTILQA